MTTASALSHRQPRHGPPLAYRAFVPTTLRSARTLVLVHGASREAGALFRAFLPAAIELGMPVLGPVFDRTAFRGYQRLAGADGHLAAAEGLVQVLGDAERELGLRTGPVDLVGFSGGAQFAHRFALLRPDLVRSLVLASAGWYTMLDQRRRFPYGVRPPAAQPDLVVHTDAFLRMPIHVLVGERDLTRDRSLRTSESLDRRQGAHRLARALSWTDHVEEVARSAGLPSRVTFDLLPDTRHSFREAVSRGGLVQRVLGAVAT